ncbi:hypothetical protein RHO15_08925 [Utexia brackfieldae]|uniref:phage neck terminator protein n=1 Tax=Utexia brackfieldae TaxID=3074108 RepID=UPI00370D0981
MSTRNTTISVNAYGDCAYQLIEQLSTSLKLSSIKQRFKRLGISLLTTSQISRQSRNESEEKEPNAQVDLIFQHRYSVSSRLSRGDAVDITLIKDDYMSLLISDVVNVSMQTQTKSAKRRDLSVTSIFTDEIGDVFTDKESRYIVVSDADTMANRFAVPIHKSIKPQFHYFQLVQN